MIGPMMRTKKFYKIVKQVDTGIYKFYKDSIGHKLFQQHGAFYSKHKQNLEVIR